MTMKKILLLCAFASLRLCVEVNAEPSPKLIPFQGRLTDQSGVAYTNGQFTILFQLYNDAVGGTAIWTERHEKVGVINGVVNVFLGSINSLDAVTFDQTKHLGITVDADNNPNTPDPEMVPRQMIIPSFWSKYSENSTKLGGYDWSAILVGGTNNPAGGQIAGNKIQTAGITTTQIAASNITASLIALGAVGSNQLATGTINSSHLSPSFALDTVIPPGTIQAFAGSTIPQGWLLCDGRSTNRTDLPRLFQAIGTGWGNSTGGTNTFNLPDLRGVFLRGVNGSRSDQWSDPEPNPPQRNNPYANGNSGNQVGSFQLDALKNHNHTFARRNDVSGASAGAFYADNGGQGYVNPFNDGLINVAGDSIESRPRNAYVNYIIKY